MVTSLKKRRLLLPLLAVLLPGLVISALALGFVSQQRKARELRLRERLESLASRARDDMETQIENAVQETFDKIGISLRAIAPYRPGPTQFLLKNIILKHPVVKYPFLIDRDNSFIFPVPQEKTFLQKVMITDNESRVIQKYRGRREGFKLYRLYKQAEAYEFRERKFHSAIKTYIQFLSGARERSPRMYALYNIARCYYKLKKYPQAAGYLGDIRENFKTELKQDKVLFLRVIQLSAKAYRQLGDTGKSVNYYLRLYDEILQYETEEQSQVFDYLKNEAQDYLQRHIGDSTTRPEGLENLTGLDISLRWRFVDTSALTERVIVRGESGGAYVFDKIREFYLPNDDKTRFYNAVKRLRPWRTVTGNEKVKRVSQLPEKGLPTVVYSNYNMEDDNKSPVFFGFMVSREFIHNVLLPEVSNRLLSEEGLKLSIVSPRAMTHPEGFPFRLTRKSFKNIMPAHQLVLWTSEMDYIDRVVRRELRFNYGLILVIIMLFILGAWLFYKYISRESQLVRMKSDFVDSASHTLKTPLTRIRMMAEKLELGWIKDENKKKEYFHNILAETDRMADMITNMLDFSKVESGRKRYEMKEGSFADVVNGVVQTQEAHIKNLGFRFMAEMEEQIPVFSFDPAAVRLILVNLLQNAVKYSKEEKYIGLRVYTENKSGADCVVLEVSDRGMGIPEKDKSKIFDQFYRVPDDETVQSLEGSGLGLFLVRHAVRAHDGEIVVSSSPDKGSVFKVYFPLKN